MWTLEQKEFLWLSLEKKEERWWDRFLKGDEAIDTTKVRRLSGGGFLDEAESAEQAKRPRGREGRMQIESVKRVEDFDEATQGHIRKIIFDENQKRQGRPSVQRMTRLAV